MYVSRARERERDLRTEMSVLEVDICMYPEWERDSRTEMSVLEVDICMYRERERDLRTEMSVLEVDKCKKSGQSVCYRSWWKQANMKMVLCKNHANC